jgi:hypothetical protein
MAGAGLGTGRRCKKNIIYKDHGAGSGGVGIKLNLQMLDNAQIQHSVAVTGAVGITFRAEHIFGKRG